MGRKPFSRDQIISHFWAKVDKNGSNGCWLWLGNKAERNYGRMYIHGKAIKAHNFSYELLVGPIPIDKELDHLCRVHECVRPEHLEPVTHRVNVLRGYSPAAIHSGKTHCPQGHPYDRDNTYIWKGRRRCRICVRYATEVYKQRKKDERRSQCDVSTL